MFLLSLLLGACSGCKRNVDYAYITTIQITNDSSHDISLAAEPEGAIYPAIINIPSGKSYEIKKSVDGGSVTLDAYVPFACKITFDETVSITHRYNDKDQYHNFCSANAYQLLSKENHSQAYRFIFSDADYEYAHD